MDNLNSSSSNVSNDVSVVINDVTKNDASIATEESLKVLMSNTDAFFLVIMGIVVFLMQLGFSFLEAGAVR